MLSQALEDPDKDCDDLKIYPTTLPQQVSVTEIRCTVYEKYIESMYQKVENLQRF